MRAGTKAPPRAPIPPPPPSLPKPPFHRHTDLPPREITLQRPERVRSQLRDRVVELAKLQEEQDRHDQNQPHEPPHGNGIAAPSPDRFNVRGLEVGERQRRSVTFFLNDDRDHELRKHSTGGPGSGGDHLLAKDTEGFPRERNIGQRSPLPPFTQLDSRSQRPPPTPPDAPRLARIRSRQGLLGEGPKANGPLDELSRARDRERPGCPSQETAEPVLGSHHHHQYHLYHEKHLTHRQDRIRAARAGPQHHLTTAQGAACRAKPATAAYVTHTNTPTVNAPKNVRKILRAPSRIALQQQHPHRGSCDPSTGDSSRSADGTSSPRSGGGIRDDKKRTDDAKVDERVQTPLAQPGGAVDVSSHPPLSPRKAERGRAFDYQRAARILNLAAQDVSSHHLVHRKGASPRALLRGSAPRPPLPAKVNAQQPLRVMHVGHDRLSGRPHSKSLKGRTDEGFPHNQPPAGDTSRQSDSTEDQEDGEVVGVRGSALPSTPTRQHSPWNSRGPDPRPPSNFISSLNMFKRRLKMNQNKFAKDVVEETEDDYVIRLLDTLPPAATASGGGRKPDSGGQNRESGNVTHGHGNFVFGGGQGQRKQLSKETPRASDQGIPDTTLTHQAGRESSRRKAASGAANLKSQAASPGRDKWTMAGDCETKSGDNGTRELEERSAEDGQADTGGKAAEEELKAEEVDELEINSSASNTNGPDSYDYFQGLLTEKARAALPQVRTYVVERTDASKPLPGQGLDLATPKRPFALTQHNVSMHNIFLQRRQEQEKTRHRRVEPGRKVGLCGFSLGGEEAPGWTQSQDADVRMRRWLGDIEYQQQKDILPVAVSFKMAVMPTA